MESRSRKNDHSCIWLKYLDFGLRESLKPFGEEQRIELTINGEPTCWVKMRGGQPGIRIIEGKTSWNGIGDLAEFSISLKSHINTAEQAPTPAPVAPSIRLERPTTSGIRQFDRYLFADYSGAANPITQRKAIKVGLGISSPVRSGFDRMALLRYVLSELGSASTQGHRFILGFDHAYGIPIGLAGELGLDGLPWRMALNAFLNGTYAEEAPSFQDDVGTFAREFNKFLNRSGRKFYFWSATKCDQYGIPNSDPRALESSETRYRHTERTLIGHQPKPLCRLGDPGTVGGQSLFGMRNLSLLIQECERCNISLRAWPFDGLDLADKTYKNAHVLVEPYPTALRPIRVPQSDENDAYWTAHTFEEMDTGGTLINAMKLGGLKDHYRTIAFEGWIFRK